VCIFIFTISSVMQEIYSVLYLAQDIMAVIMKFAVVQTTIK